MTAIALAAALAGVPVAEACSVPPPPTFTKSFPHAKYVFVFRLDSVDVQRNQPHSVVRPGKAMGHFTIIRSFRGAPKYKKISFSTALCGGNRLDVGHHFLVLASGAGDTIELKLSDGTVVDISYDYMRAPDRLYNALSRGTLPPGFPSRAQANYTLSVAYPD